MGDETAGEFEECFVDVSPAFPADAQASEAVEPGEGPLDHSPVSAQSCAVPGAAAGDGWHDASLADLVAVRIVVVAAVGEERVRLAAGRPTRPRTGGIASSNGSSWVTSLRLPPVTRTASGVPCPSVIR